MALYLGSNQVDMFSAPVPPGSDKIKVKVKGPNNTHGFAIGYTEKNNTIVSGCAMSLFVNNRDFYLPPTKDGKGLLFAYAEQYYGISLSNTSTGATLISKATTSGSIAVECEPNAEVVLSTFSNT